MQICSFTKDLKLEQVENIHVCVNLTWISHQSNESYDPVTRQQFSVEKQTGAQQRGPTFFSFLFTSYVVKYALRFFPQGQTVNVELYCIIFRHLRENIQLKQPEL